MRFPFIKNTASLALKKKKNKRNKKKEVLQNAKVRTVRKVIVVVALERYRYR